MKRLIVFLLVLVLAGSLGLVVSCKTTVTPTTEAESATESSTEEASTEETTAPKVFEGTLVVWEPEVTDACRAVKEELAKEYSEINPGVTVKFEFFPFEGFYEKLGTGLIGTEGPDITYVPYEEYDNFNKGGGLSTAPAEVKEWFLSKEPFQSELNVIIRNDELVGLPWENSIMVMFYNKGMFAEAGLDRAPQTWEELVEFGKKLTKTDSSGNLTQWAYAIRYSGNPAGVVEKWIPFLWQNGGDLLTEDLSKPAFNTPEGREALQFFVDMIHKHKISSLSVQDPNAAFKDELAAIFYREAWVPAWIKVENPDMQVGTAPLLSRKEKASSYGLNFFAVTSACKDKELAWDFLKFMLDNKNHARMAEAQGLLPWNLQEVDEPYFKTMPDLQVYVDSLAYGRTFQLHPRITEINNALATEMLKAFDNVVTVEEALSKAEQNVIEIMQRQ